MGNICLNTLKPTDKDQMTVAANDHSKNKNLAHKEPTLTTRSNPTQRKVQKQKNISHKPDKTSDKLVHILLYYHFFQKVLKK